MTFIPLCFGHGDFDNIIVIFYWTLGGNICKQMEKQQLRGTGRKTTYRIFAVNMALEKSMALSQFLTKADLLKQGAEARVYRGMFLGKPTIAKERFPKQYRHPVLDEKLTHRRTTQEVRSILRCRKAGNNVKRKPHVINSSLFSYNYVSQDFIYYCLTHTCIWVASANNTFCLWILLIRGLGDIWP